MEQKILFFYETTKILRYFNNFSLQIGDCPTLPTDQKEKSGEVPSSQQQRQPKAQQQQPKPPQQQQQPKPQQQQQQPKSEETVGEANNEDKGNNKRNRPRPKKNVNNKTE